MFVYLSKKIAIPNNTRLKCVSYNRMDGYIACGGDDGLLKVLKLEAQITKDSKVKGLAAASNLSMNQPLEGHKAVVTVLTWNERNQKLTSGDQNGFIIVWILHKGTWFEEMINTRSKSVVRGMKWNSDGSKICISYADGAVIVGSVDGNRIWGKDLKNTELTQLEWSPDSRLLLFGVAPTGEVHVYDKEGTFIAKLPILCQGSNPVAAGQFKVVSIEWYNGLQGFMEANCPTLAICFDNGRCQLMRTELDPEPILFDAGIQITSAQWNQDGTVLAIAGSARTTEKDLNNVQFYSPFGEHLRTLKVPGKELTCCSWEGGGLRLALAVDSFIYFANIRPDYKWCYFADTVVYAYTRPDRIEHSVVFWDTKNNEKHVKYVKNLVSIVAGGDLCCVTFRSDDLEAQQRYVLWLCNSIGTPIDMKEIDLMPAYVTMTGTHIVVASPEAFFTWQFKNLKQLATIEVSGKRRAGTEKLYHIDDSPSGVGGDLIDFNKASLPTQDSIVAVCISDKILLLARESGMLNEYLIPSLQLVNRHKLGCRPHRLSLNNNSSRLAIIDMLGVLTFYNLDASPTSRPAAGNANTPPGAIVEPVKIEPRKDVWDMKWAEDNSEMFVMMEKTRMFIFRNGEPEDPIASSGYICQFKDLQIKSVFLDEIMMEPDSKNLDNIVIMEVKALRDTRELLERSGIEEALKFVEVNQHPRLWRLLAEFSLEKLNLKIAEQSFVHAKDYTGIQFVKRLGNLQSESMKLAEVASYFGRFDEAEKMYIDMDRKDLAIALRKNLGDWFRVAQLLKTSSSNESHIDHNMEEACNAIGDYYADRQKWQLAIPQYEKGRNQERLAKCYYMMEDYAGLKKMVDYLPENHRLLPEIADMFSTVGMCQEAVDANLKCDRVKQAIDTCLELNQWNVAIELAKKHDVREIDSMLVKYAELLVEKKKVFNAVELYRNANRYLEAAKMLFKIADKEAKKRSKPLRLKKIYVLAALLVEQYHDYMKNTSRSKTKQRRGAEATSAIAGLLEEDSAAMSDTRVIDNAWRGAEAYHFYTLAQRQLYEGLADSAMKTALHLREYDDVLNPVEIYSLLALAAAATRSFAICSKAFIKLETLDSITPVQRQKYEELGLEIFTTHSPKDTKVEKVECTSCGSAIPDSSHVCPSCDAKFPTCIVTGRPIFANLFWMCQACKHRASEKAIIKRNTCPLCHTKLS